MGYRSDVAIKIYGNKEKLKQVKDFAEAKFVKLDAEQQSYVEDLIKESEEYLDRSLWEDDDEEDDASFFFFAQWVKWYDGYPSVDYFNAIFKKAKEIGLADEDQTESDLLYGEFVRIGEEMDDNEEDRFNTGMDDQLTIRRSIEY